MESTKLINPQTLSSALASLLHALQPRAFRFINFVDSTVYAYNYYINYPNKMHTMFATLWQFAYTKLLSPPLLDMYAQSLRVIGSEAQGVSSNSLPLSMALFYFQA